MKRTKQLLAFAILAVAAWTAWSPLAKSDGFSGHVWYAKCGTSDNNCQECIAWIGYSDGSGTIRADDTGTTPSACFVGQQSTSASITTNICIQDTSVYHYYCIQDGNSTVQSPCTLIIRQCTPWYADEQRCNTESNSTCMCSTMSGMTANPLYNLPLCTGSGLLP
jgi:hypothetical protein